MQKLIPNRYTGREGMGSFASITRPQSQPDWANTSVLFCMGQQWTTVSLESGRSTKALMEDILFPLTHGKADSTHTCMKERQRKMVPIPGNIRFTPKAWAETRAFYYRWVGRVCSQGLRFYF